LKKRKTKTFFSGRLPFLPPVRPSCNAPAPARHSIAAHPRGLFARALSLSLADTRPPLVIAFLCLSLSPSTRPCPHGGQPVFIASVAQPSCSTASPLHGDPILLPSDYATTSGGPSRRPWRTDGHGDRRPGGLLR
jgi:hypothetical protein